MTISHERGANSVFAFKKNVFVCGSYRDDESYRTRPALWKNGVPQRLLEGDGEVTAKVVMESVDEANSVYVAGVGDVYVAGEEKYFATLWKNGIPQHLSDGRKLATATSVFVSVESDVYIVGLTYTFGDDSEDEDGVSLENTVAMLWKNGIPMPLSDGKSFARASSVYVVNKDVYIAGQEGESAVLWRNGKKTVLGKGMATSIFVK